MIIELYIILTWPYYEVKVRNEMSLFLGENQYFHKKKNNPIFCNRTGKDFKSYSFYLSWFKFHAALFNLHISCRVYLWNPLKHFHFFLPRKLTFLYSGIFWEMHVLLFHRYQGIVILWKWRTYSKDNKWKPHLLFSVISYQVLTHIKRGPSDPGSLTWVFV